jgi:hypothetical protein
MTRVGFRNKFMRGLWRAALIATEPKIRATYHDLAKQWRELAAQIGELDRLL